MHIIEFENDFNIPRASSVRVRRSSSFDFSFSPLLLINGLSRKSLSYSKLPQQPLKLSVLKLDGSCFDVEVAKTATIAELKQAVESVFSHFPEKGLGKISWPHVWGQFCLCYDGQKLLTETECINNYGIKDGDQLHFVRHVSITYTLIKRGSNKGIASRKQHKIIDEGEEGEQSSEEDVFEDLENPKPQHFDEENEDLDSQHEMIRQTHLLKGWFSYSRLSSRRRKLKGRSHSSRFASSFLVGLQKIIRIYSGKCS
ncbi:uncharacterized protein LOC131150459 [Malania oleifera]|uniref:uncharacterized protein LOC131150459 n=1 Tax=Malania oleifera TaxID=397392 RepID=UPI0025AE54B5|nr:uncharacterized protein LOC131150459 [Malania oleifera]